MGRGDTENGSEYLDNLLLYLGLQLSHVQMLNVMGTLAQPEIESLRVCLTILNYCKYCSTRSFMETCGLENKIKCSQSILK